MTGRGAQSGVTIVEVAVGASILVAMLIAIGLSMKTSFRVWKSSAGAVEVDRIGHRGLHDLASVLGDAGRSTLVPDPLAPDGADSLSFQTTAGFSGSTLQWSAAQLVEWQSDPTDPEDGVDNDGDGLVDEGVVVLLPNAAQPDRKRILVRDVAPLAHGEIDNDLDDNGNGLDDERGFAVVREGSMLRIRLTVMRRDLSGENAVRTMETSVALTN